ncbi:MAG: glycosyltransferase family 4 protein [Muribaculum sp.]|nr:glycosyltransferase family 4 protein [Muribaculum sp.]
MKNRIAIIGAKGLPAQDGISRVVEGYIPYLTDKYDFTVFCTNKFTNRKSGEYDGYREIVFKSINSRLNTLLYYIKSSFKLLFGEKYDLVHFHHCDASFLFPLIKLRYGNKLLVTTHGAFTPLNDKWKKFKLYFYLQYRIFLKSAPHLTGVSKNEVTRTQNILKKVSAFIPNGINTNESISNIDVGSDYVFFAAGRIMALKGLHLMLSALHKINYEKEIIIAGDISMAPKEFKEQIEQLSQGLNIKYIGLVRDKSLLMKYIKSSKLFIFPSLAETMSMQLLEATSMNTPVIASDIQENRDIFNEDEVLFFKSNNVEDLSSKINYALMHMDDMRERANKAYRHLISAYSWDKIASDYDKIYNSIINEK